MSIFPLEQFETDVAEYRREVEERIKAQRNEPKTVVVKFGHMRLIGEYPYQGEVQPGCGSKLVVRTHRGTELTTLVTSTCKNAGCGSSVTRQEMLQYIEASGGRDYPFFSDGRALRVATAEDLTRQSKLDAGVDRIVRDTREVVAELGLEMNVVDAEPILGGERLTIYFTAEDRVDFRELARRLSSAHHTRIDLRQVGVRDEARLTADYERCGQYCCCKQFLKVLKPVSMRSAKVQKATLDPLKISGRCGRLMCCLRYEDETYTELRKNLPHRKSRVGTEEGPGIVVDTQILTQLALVELEADGRRIAVPVENLIDPEEAERLVEEQRLHTARELEQARSAARLESRRGGGGRDRDGGGRSRTGVDQSADDAGGVKKKQGSGKPRRGRSAGGAERKQTGDRSSASPGDGAQRKKRRRRRRRGGGGGGGNTPGGADPS